MRTLLVAVIAAFARYAAAEEVLIQLKGTVTGVEEGFAPWPVKVGDTVRAQYTYSLPAPADQYDEPERGYYSFPNARFNVDAGALVFGQRDLYIYVQDYPAADQHVVASEAHLGDVVRRIDRKSTRLNSSHHTTSRMPSSA